jgi:hypothetical protein
MKNQEFLIGLSKGASYLKYPTSSEQLHSLVVVVPPCLHFYEGLQVPALSVRPKNASLSLALSLPLLLYHLMTQSVKHYSSLKPT